jgi:hypothetical protein
MSQWLCEVDNVSSNAQIGIDAAFEANSHVFVEPRYELESLEISHSSHTNESVGEVLDVGVPTVNLPLHNLSSVPSGRLANF